MITVLQDKLKSEQPSANLWIKVLCQFLPPLHVGAGVGMPARRLVLHIPGKSVPRATASSSLRFSLLLLLLLLLIIIIIIISVLLLLLLLPCNYCTKNDSHCHHSSSCCCRYQHPCHHRDNSSVKHHQRNTSIVLT